MTGKIEVKEMYEKYGKMNQRGRDGKNIVSERVRKLNRHNTNMTGRSETQKWRKQDIYA